MLLAVFVVATCSRLPVSRIRILSERAARSPPVREQLQACTGSNVVWCCLTSHVYPVHQKRQTRLPLPLNFSAPEKNKKISPNRKDPPLSDLFIYIGRSPSMNTNMYMSSGAAESRLACAYRHMCERPATRAATTHRFPQLWTLRFSGIDRRAILRSGGAARQGQASFFPVR